MHYWLSSPTRFTKRYLAGALLCIALSGSPTLQGAATTPGDGTRLLMAELPAGTTIPQANCDLLGLAVNRATLAHRSDAQAILAAALSGGGRVTPRKKAKRNDHDRLDEERSCPCVRHLFHQSVVAAPEQASFLLEIAIAFYPQCADSLEAALNDDAGDGGYGFGVGFGPGFPGSPGFSGSPPSGATALPTPAPETSVVNG